MTDTTDLSFCEPAWATPTSKVHLRRLNGEPRKPGGGVTTNALCGATVVGGWDLGPPVTPDIINARLGAETGPTCPNCAAAALG